VEQQYWEWHEVVDNMTDTAVTAATISKIVLKMQSVNKQLILVTELTQPL
jgi:hypothetical protein